ncbi:hypothetical protein HDU93_003929 [Gonapodya sp. JEL0774]|nr:hypothetical protein HDU93_003929 [Gonapodya sp. JEL0774]
MKVVFKTPASKPAGNLPPPPVSAASPSPLVRVASTAGFGDSEPSPGPSSPAAIPASPATPQHQSSPSHASKLPTREGPRDLFPVAIELDPEAAALDWDAAKTARTIAVATVLSRDLRVSHVTQGALVMLADAFDFYFLQILRALRSYLDLAGRLYPNLLDVRNLLADADLPLLQLQRYADSLARKSEQGAPILRTRPGRWKRSNVSPEFTFRKHPLLGPEDAGPVDKRPAAVPRWMPPYPMPYTYRFTPVVLRPALTPAQVRALYANQSRNAITLLLQRAASNPDFLPASRGFVNYERQFDGPAEGPRVVQVVAEDVDVWRRRVVEAKEIEDEWKAELLSKLAEREEAEKMEEEEKRQAGIGGADAVEARVGGTMAGERENVAVAESIQIGGQTGIDTSRNTVEPGRVPEDSGMDNVGSATEGIAQDQEDDIVSEALVAEAVHSMETTFPSEPRPVVTDQTASPDRPPPPPDFDKVMVANIASHNTWDSSERPPDERVVHPEYYYDPQEDEGDGDEADLEADLAMELDQAAQEELDNMAAERDASSKPLEYAVDHGITGRVDGDVPMGYEDGPEFNQFMASANDAMNVMAERGSVDGRRKEGDRVLAEEHGGGT